MLKEFIAYQLIGIVALVLTSKEKKLLGQLPINVMALLVAFWPAVIALGLPGILRNIRDWTIGLAFAARQVVYDFLVKRGWVSLVVLALAVAPLAAQQKAPAATKNPTLMIFADTAGIARVHNEIFVTWVFARATPTALPSSGVLVGFDCEQHLVKRLAHVVYHMTADSAGVMGNIIEETASTWVAPVIPRLFDLVCSIGATRPAAEPEVRMLRPTTDPKHLYPIS